MKDRYLSQVLQCTPHILSNLDRDPLSPSYGSFDRKYWGWKFKDFSDATLQCAVMPLMRVWQIQHSDNPYYGSLALKQWIHAAMDYLVKIQHPDGSFDQCYPNERAVGVVYDVFEAMVLYHEGLLQLASEERRQWFRVKMRKAAEFALHHVENHGMIANHFAHYAYISFLMGRFFGEREFELLAESWLRKTLSLQDEEGWFLEYVGADPGYETRNLHYLTKIYQEFSNPSLREPIQNSIQKFLVYCVHPDGTLGGEYGSRNTMLCYPAPFERMSSEIPEAMAISRSLRMSLQRSDTQKLHALDLDNMLRLANSYLEAYVQPEATGPESVLPCHQNSLHKIFRRAGIYIETTADFYLIVNLAKGGVYKMYAKNPARLILSNTGYAADRLRGPRICSNFDQSSPDWTCDANEIQLTGKFYQTLQENVSVWQFLVLRLLAVSFLRLDWLAIRFRRYIASRLFLRKVPHQMQLMRRFIVENDCILIQDRITNISGIRSLLTTTHSTPTHMASSKYFSLSQIFEQAATDEEIDLTIMDGGELFIRTKITKHEGGWRVERNTCSADEAESYRVNRRVA